MRKRNRSLALLLVGAMTVSAMLAGCGNKSETPDAGAPKEKMCIRDSFCIGWCYDQCGSILIDTHRQNIPMQRTLKKNGFTRCGVIYLEDGSERIAYQK